MTKVKVDLATVRERDRLKPQTNRAPHWQRLQEGVFVGYRPAADNSAGLWSARVYNEDTKRYHERALGAFPGSAASDRFALAKKEAEAIAAQLEAGGRAKGLASTVEEALREYAAEHPDADTYFRLIYGSDDHPKDPIAAIPLAKLHQRHLEAWRKRLEARPAKIGRRTGKGAQNATRTRAQSSINREMAPLRAALNAQKLPNVGWREAIKPISAKTAAVSRDVYLTTGQRQALLASCSAQIEPFLRALCLLPVRPGAMAKLVVADLNKGTGKLKIRAGIDKDQPERSIPLSAAALALLIQQSKGKTPAAPLFHRENLAPWDRHTWKKVVRAAVTAAKLDPLASAYTLRHSVITDLVNLGVPTLNIAKLAGTSVKMIEDHYGKLLDDAAVEALDKLAL